MIFSGKKGRKRRRIVLVETLKIEENSLKKKVFHGKKLLHTGS